MLSYSLALHHVVLILAHVLFLLILELLVFVGILDAFFVDHVVFQLLDIILVVFIALLILALVDHLSSLVLVLLLLNQHLIMLV